MVRLTFKNRQPLCFVRQFTGGVTTQHNWLRLGLSEAMKSGIAVSLHLREKLPGVTMLQSVPSP